MDPNNKKDQKNNQNRNRNMRGVVTLIIWALVLTVVFNYINAYSNNLTKRAMSPDPCRRGQNSCGLHLHCVLPRSRSGSVPARCCCWCR